MRKIIFLILSFFTFSFVYAEEIDVNKDYFFLISHRLGLINFEKTDCSEKNIENKGLDIKALCYLRNYLEDKNADLFIKNSRQLGIDNLAKIDEIVTSINVFSLCFYIFLAEATLKNPQDGLPLLFDIMKNKESYPNIQEAVSLIFYRAPFFTAKNISLIKKLIDEDKNFREFDISCRTSSFHSILGYTDIENIKEAEYVFYRACPNLYKTTKRNKNKKDLFLNEKNGFGLETNVCSLSIATNATEKPIVLKIEEKKELSTITIKGAEKDNLNYFYKYIYDGTFVVDTNDIKNIFDSVRKSKFWNSKKGKLENELFYASTWKGSVLECTIDKKHIIEYEGYNEIGTRLSNLPNLIQMLAAKTVPAGSYNMAEELKKDYTAIMESVKKPVCNNESEKELTIFSALPYIDGLDKNFVLKELPYFIEFGNSYTFYFLTRLIKTNNIYHLNYRSKDPYKVWGPHFFDISGIEVLKGDKALDSVDKILKNNKTTAPDFIWRSWGKEFVIVYKDDSGCKFLYEIKKCSLCEAPLMDEIWKSLGKEIQGLLKSETGSGKIKTYNSDLD